MNRLSIAAIIVSIAVIAATGYGVFRFYGFTSSVREKIEMAVYLENGADTPALRADISRITEVRSVVFISKEEALRMLKREMGDTGIFTAIPSNPLPDSLIVKLKSKYAAAENFEKVRNSLGLLPGVSEVAYEKKFLERSLPLVTLGEKIALVCGLVLIGYASFTIILAVRASGA
ncbi:hypothetical protein COY52_06590 [Candidatus Desantisbacteria bacterium CG_4_10_14_0_8_um_filter_48_22]|uniref:FtsX extracellular domain-containing protein n=1 Tax=Candidatus Desantisbacteria bacterium CG_4_10_14_0_8_um_filter_48_22 TaxID=1974543 RepID=A0A2M7SB03_9BACT|nr:MAG: hypothetical protein AUJ67_09165 [Candidatus Desantisbacteria bacterium CG1_02_49_89]PIV54915.1 MAG: hypothetical protein COS16_08815 [Candidatus Desantisbacteria bacterium CG02_land_8_20_14_3_00_49_13]PIZ16639.1 MAG: hypothetical protein COY52_06590 [Candidatus Desantisbacteria bacterium CG_4_10_14_0_8_um_filter_48_22]PJB28783.1 MAG: hypothetical protein CO111_00735 [Candidatus Desantisbacteria bacterium CG_4_9_14_3_um_filter_50_7]